MTPQVVTGTAVSEPTAAGASATDATEAAPPDAGFVRDPELLRRIEQRVLWLAVRMVDHANHDRNDPGGIKVGGHQASSASMVSIITALWFGFLRAEDRVAVKPHASPLLHAISYLTGDLDRRYLTELRAYKGLQAYPSRTKDPFHVDYSTGSVGLGIAAPVFGAVAASYVRAHFGVGTSGRFIGLAGDAELDEGNVWEAIADPVTQDLDDIIWVVDLNRQSLDRVVTGVRAARLEAMFAANGWQVIEAKYGSRLQAVFAAPRGESVRRHIDEMTNEQYQACFGKSGAELREHFLTGADRSVRRALAEIPDDELAGVISNLGGHDFAELIRCLDEAERARGPAVVMAYTVKGWGLPIAGDRLNHAALLSRRQIDDLRAACGLTPDGEWDAFAAGSPEQLACEAVSRRLQRAGVLAGATAAGGRHDNGHDNARVPATATAPGRTEVGVATAKPVSTQEVFGRLLASLAGDEKLAPHLVTTSPDVAVSTNLGGWVNRVGVFSHQPKRTWDGDSRLLRWTEEPAGRHIELGISEMNLFLLLGQLGLTREMLGVPLVPIGTVYDPFVLRGLDALVHSLYSGARFVIVGTPSGITLSYEGGAHQSVITPSVGLELPGIGYLEPAYATALDWMLCDALDAILDGRGGSVYLRLSTRPLDQAPFAAARERLGPDELRRQVLAGGYKLVDSEVSAPGLPDRVVVAACGAVVEDAVAAAAMLAAEGVAADVIDVTSPDRLFRQWREVARQAVDSAVAAPLQGHLRSLLPAAGAAPIVTVHDSSAHALAFLGSVLGSPVVPLGVDDFGQSGSIPDLYRHYGIDAGAIVNAALLALEGSAPAEPPPAASAAPADEPANGARR